MKRIALCVGLVAVVGLVGFGWNPGDPIPASENPLERPSSFTIPAAFVMFAEGDLLFSGVELTNVQLPGYVGWAKTNTLTVYGLTNQALSVTGEAHAYKHTLCPKILPTRLTGYAYVWDGTAWVAPPPPLPGGGTYEIYPLYTGGVRTATQVLPVCAAGYYKGVMYLEVYRNGFSDPAGLYTAKVKITVTGL